MFKTWKGNTNLNETSINLIAKKQKVFLYILSSTVTTKQVIKLIQSKVLVHYMLFLESCPQKKKKRRKVIWREFFQQCTKRIRANLGC